MLDWLMDKMGQRVRRKALEKTARKRGISQAYLADVIGNIEACSSGQISYTQFRDRAMEIAYRYPEDSKIAAILNEEEWRS
jgi:hypothetical protein